MGWEWDSAAKGHALGGVIVGASRAASRYVIEQQMRETGALSALARQVRHDPDWGTYERTGAAMIAAASGRRAGTITWRDVDDPAAAS